MNTSRSWLALIFAVSLLVSLLMHQTYSGAYVRSTPVDKYTYYIGVVSTTIPFAFWALVTFLVSLINRGRPNHGLAILGGYLAGWIGMTAFTFWIVTWPRTYGHSSTMAIAVGLTAFMHAAIFPILFPFGYFITRLLLHRKREV